MTIAALKKTALFTLVPVEGLPSLFEAITGESKMKGSWWGHPQGGEIFTAAGKLEESGDYLICKLAAGKVTFVHRSLWPAFFRVVSDPVRQINAAAGLPAAALELSRAAAVHGGIRLDEWLAAKKLTPEKKKGFQKAKLQLESRLLLHSEEFHTDSGRHTTRLMRWEAWADEKTRKAAEKISFEAAKHDLETALNGAGWGK